MKQKSAGFTLLEVMVALSICAMAGIAAMQVTGEHITHVGSLEEQTYASWVAENQMVMMRSSGEKWSGKNGKKGEEELAGQKWYWQQSVTKTEDASFVKVTVTVYQDEELKHSIYDLTTFMLKGK
ncbi:type II secretion system protein GspI [Pseudoalteromonas citrea]|uniref:Type II secretion system protein I n=1 Tax=Pseudoalteromonas citrea TaxID=43655 RepID=A0A5S3XK49_9GAMM|nr:MULTISPECIES: type II secretion system minor pseudopilin GspI [Pseudoalteromonas]RJE78379.1 type II secretion system protein GspI [Pseudoalteromonas sp. MSK9-3]TMP47361.1 type II secretion system protein GspI [Pseudoalteromonas citrea]TMP54993.1 type II secretion system protein GspI [Pseudoalteromonas citrea]